MFKGRDVCWVIRFLCVEVVAGIGITVRRSSKRFRKNPVPYGRMQVERSELLADFQNNTNERKSISILMERI